MTGECPHTEQNDALYLRELHGEQFDALATLTGEAAGILAVKALSQTARMRDIWADRRFMADLSDEFKDYAAGPLSAEDALWDYNKKRAPLPLGEVAIATDFDRAPLHRPREKSLAPILGYSAGSSAVEYTNNPLHESFVQLATGRFNHYYGAQSRIELPGRNYFYIRAPIGEYGSEAASNLLEATYKTMLGPDKQQLTRLNELADRDNNRALILNHTTFGRKERNTAIALQKECDKPLGMALAYSLHEGDLSIQQAVSMLTAQKVRGFDTMESLWAAIRQAGLVRKLTSLLPFGEIAPATDMNMFIPDLAVPAAAGVRLNDAVEKKLRAYKQQTRARVAKYHRNNPGMPSRNEMGMVCPALKQGGGLNERHDVLYARFTGEYPPVRGLIRRFF